MIKSRTDPILSLILLFIVNCTSSVILNDDTTKTVSTTGFFEGKIVSAGNFQRELVYKINDYYIYINDITPGQADLFKGKKVRVTGKLKFVPGKLFPAKSSTDGTIYEPYKEPDKKFIQNPVFTVID